MERGSKISAPVCQLNYCCELSTFNKVALLNFTFKDKNQR